jgi:RHS repeat-associated protein
LFWYTGQREPALSEAKGKASFGLYYYGARWYDPALGRFVQADTIVPEASQGVQAWDRYAYVNNNPLQNIDPTGHWGISINFHSILSSIINQNPFGISSNQISNGLDMFATGCDAAAFAIDYAIASGELASAAIGGTAGAAFSSVDGGVTVPVTGPAGALTGLGVFEINPIVRGMFIAGNGLSSLATAFTFQSDIISGETNAILDISTDENSFEFQFMVGRDTTTSSVLSGLGWASPLGVTSVPLEGAALLNDRDCLFIGPLKEIPKSLPVINTSIQWK